MKTHNMTGAAKAERLLSVSQVGDLLGVSPRTVRRMIHEGKLRGVRVTPRRVRVPESSVCHLIERGGVA